MGVLFNRDDAFNRANLNLAECPSFSLTTDVIAANSVFLVICLNTSLLHYACPLSRPSGIPGHVRRLAQSARLAGAKAPSQLER